MTTWQPCPDSAEEGGHGGGERFAFAGLHFGDVAFEHGDGPHDLHGEVSHIQSSSGGFADECVGIGEQLIQWNAGRGLPSGLFAMASNSSSLSVVRRSPR